MLVDGISPLLEGFLGNTTMPRFPEGALKHDLLLKVPPSLGR